MVEQMLRSAFAGVDNFCRPPAIKTRLQKRSTYVRHRLLPTVSPYIAMPHSLNPPPNIAGRFRGPESQGFARF